MPGADMFGLAWEENMLEECVCYADVVLHVNLVVGGRQWQLEPTKGYIVMDVYHLSSTTNQPFIPHCQTLCRKKAHLKV